MATTYSVSVGLGLLEVGDQNWGPILTTDLTLLDAQNAVGDLAVQVTEVPSASLNVRVAGGVYVNQAGVVSTYAGTSSFALTASGTNSLYLDLTASGALTKSTSGFPATAHVRIASVVAGTGTVTSITDARVAFTAVGPWADGVNIAFGTTTGTQIGTGATQKIGLWGKTPVVQQTGGSATAGGSYTATEQNMIQVLWNMARTIGLLS